MNVSNIKNGSAIVSTPLVTVIKYEIGFCMLITCKDGSVIEHEPFPCNLEGMVAAISLCAEINAGKFFLKSVYSTKKESLKITGGK